MDPRRSVIVGAKIVLIDWMPLVTITALENTTVTRNKTCMGYREKIGINNDEVNLANTVAFTTVTTAAKFPEKYY